MKPLGLFLKGLSLVNGEGVRIMGVYNVPGELGYLEGMTQAKWDRITQTDREKARDMSQIHPKLRHYVGERVEVTYEQPYACLDGGYTLKECFRVGRSTGWRPVLLALYNSRSSGGNPIIPTAPIASVRRV